MTCGPRITWGHVTEGGRLAIRERCLARPVTRPATREMGDARIQLFDLIGRQSGVGAGPACWLLVLPTIWPTCLWAEISFLSGRTDHLTRGLPSCGGTDWNFICCSKQTFIWRWSKAKSHSFLFFNVTMDPLFKRKCHFSLSYWLLPVDEFCRSPIIFPNHFSFFPWIFILLLSPVS